MRVDRQYYYDFFRRQNYKGCGTTLMGMAVMLALLFLLSGCKTKYVPVTEVHTEYKHTVDSVRQVDSVFHEKETVVMQLDSAAMAEYGIQLQSAERAWLVRSKEMEQKIARLMAQKTDTVIKVDSIPKIIVKEKELSKWQRLKMDAGVAAMAIAAALILLFVIKLTNRRFI